MSINAALQPTLPWPLRFFFVPLIAAGVAYYASAQVAFAIGTLTQMFAPFWPPNVVLVCTLLMVPERRWWAYLLAVFPAHVAAELGVAMPVPQLLVAFSCNVAVALLTALTLRRVLGPPPWLDRLRNASLYLLIAVVVSPGLVAFAGGVEPTFGQGDPSQYWSYWWRWYLSNALGSLTLTPVFLTWFHEGVKRPGIASAIRLIEAVALGLSLAVTCAVAFGAIVATADHLFPTLLYAPVPFLLWAAVRFGGRGASSAILIVTVLSIWCAMQGEGPFAGGAPGQSVLPMQLFLAVISVPVILLAALMEELRSTNNRLLSVLEGISDCYFTLDRDYKFTSINPKAEAWFAGTEASPLLRELPAEVPTDAASSFRVTTEMGERRVTEQNGAQGITGQLVGRRLWESMPNVYGSNVEGQFRRAMEGRVTLQFESPSPLHPERWQEFHIYPIPEGISVFASDITARKTVELAARATQELLQSSLDALSAHIAVLDGEATIIAVNAAWRCFADAHGYAGRDYGVGVNYLRVCEAAIRDRHEASAIAAGLRAIIRDERKDFRIEYPCYGADGKSWFQLRVTRFGVGTARRIVVAHECITEVKRAEEGLRRLTGRLLKVQDEERRRIARELHDSTAQNMLGALIGLDRVLRLPSGLSRRMRHLVQESRDLIELSQREIRTVSYLLHPPLLDEAGLPSAIRWYVDGFAKRSGITVNVEVSPELVGQRLPSEIETALFRVVQEALANVHRHSGSSVARVCLQHVKSPDETSGDLVLAIEDQGHGACLEDAGDMAAGSKSGSAEEKWALGVGVTGMRERIGQLGGRLQIRSDQAGTTVFAILPCPGCQPGFQHPPFI